MFGLGAQPAPVPGAAAPPFSLTGHEGQTVRLVDFRGNKRVILAFYPQDDTPG